MTAAEIARLRELLANATPGPWEADDDRSWQEWAVLGPAGFGRLFFCLANDAALIAALRNAAPELLDAIEERDRLRAAHLAAAWELQDDDE